MTVVMSRSIGIYVVPCQRSFGIKAQHLFYRYVRRFGEMTNANKEVASGEG